MGIKDIEEKQFEDYNDVFADIVNVLLLDGKQVVKSESLENSKDRSRFKAATGKITEQERDVSKWWKKTRIRLALFGLENQTDEDPRICFRLLGYDGAVYKSQYNEKNTYPVITLVLYFNYERRWKKAKSLLEGIKVPDGLMPYVNDYRMNLFEIAWLSDEQVKMFCSDFKIVADYFVQMRKNKRYNPSKDTIEHVDAVMKIMTALTGDMSFEDTYNSTPIEERSKITMCKVIEDAKKSGMRFGVKFGDYNRLVNIVNDYIAKKKITQKAACQDLSIDYKEYLVAKRYLKKNEIKAII
ncbi:MAG: Rpn family recombination-promoting nuclease/putative transposase [Lachnospiraceae bacterium]|nr:Rpn family recombination-promoting nuclease/putative transposase [Lachnospiraceae bacterium]